LSQPPKIFASLQAEVINKELCTFCGGCIAACPVNVVVPAPEEKPTLKGRCILCGLCYYSCPRVELPLRAIEQAFFDRDRTEKEAILGIHHEIWSARSTDEAILKVCQDGGVVTSLLGHALKNKVIDHAVVVGTDSANHWRPRGVVISNSDQLAQVASSKYTATGSLAALADAVAGYPASKLAIVGLPCQIQTLRRMHTRGNSKLTEQIAFTIGLFCYNTYRYQGLIQELVVKQHNVDPGQITKMECKNNLFRAYQGDQVKIEVPLKKLTPYVLPGCQKCRDFTAELADISIGHAGSEEGWCTVITRTEKGVKLLEDCCTTGFVQRRTVSVTDPRVNLVMKLSEKKREREAPYLRD